MVTKWLAYPSTDDFREYTNIAIELATQYQVKYWLCDNTKGIMLTLDQQRWKAERLAKSMLGSGLQRIALVAPREALYQIVLYQIAEKFTTLVEDKIAIEAFSKAELANEWLLDGELLHHS